MVYESSYECGRMPFRPDATRGTWASPSDFVFAAIGLVFRLDVFALSTSIGYLTLAPVVFIPYLLRLCTLIVPIFVIQCFMGQFSSSGFISAFRVTPIFKGIGYISLAVNISILTYYSMFAAIPMLFLFNSLRPTLPWGCDGVKQRLNDNQGAMKHICNFETKKDPNVTHEYKQFDIIDGRFFYLHFRTNEIGMFSFLYECDFVVSWQMLLCTMLTWLIVACLFWKFYNTQTFGKIIRFTMGTTLVVMLLCLVRFCFLPGSENRLSDYFFPRGLTIPDLLYSMPLLTVSSFGAGWGSIIVLSSFNKFRTNIMRQSWLILLGQTVVWLSLGGIAFLIEDYLHELVNKGGRVSYERRHLTLYLPAAEVLGSIGWPNFWSILYYGMLTLSAFVTMLTQLFGIFTSIFDEYESLRTRKSTVIFSLLGFLALCSLFSCTSLGINYFHMLFLEGNFTQTALNLLLLLVVLWIYGRVRFQRDIEFMLGQRFATWKVYMLRFVSPLALIVIFLTALYIVVLRYSSGLIDFFVEVILIILPWLFVPGYMIFILLQTTGGIMMRFKRCCRPYDWYPVDMEERQRYEDAMGNLDTTHQLKDVDEQIVVP